MDLLPIPEKCIGSNRYSRLGVLRTRKCRPAPGETATSARHALCVRLIGRVSAFRHDFQSLRELAVVGYRGIEVLSCYRPLGRFIDGQREDIGARIVPGDVEVELGTSKCV